MPAPRQEDEEQEEHLSTNCSLLESVETSPTNSRRDSDARRYRPFMLPSSSDLTARLAEHQPQDERAPLLTGQSRIRIIEGTGTPRPRLSRHHSYAGMF
jgi:hypothetical protein